MVPLANFVHSSQQQLSSVQVVQALLTLSRLDPSMMTDADAEMMLGIDEAGRGPVLGPMVYAYAACPIARQAELRELGFADSKQLTAAARESLLALLRNTGWLHSRHLSISPQLLSACMQRSSRLSLNVISHDAALSLIQSALHSGLLLREVYVDTVGDCRAYQAKLEAAFPALRFTVTPKADSLFPIVSAASIVAKVQRDAELESWHFTEQQQPLGADEDSEDDGSQDEPRKRRRLAEAGSAVSLSDALGSGYPGDAVTRRWLLRHLDPVFGFPSLVRFSWSTARDALKQRGAAAVRWHDGLDDDGDDGSQRQQRAASARNHRMEAFMQPAADLGTADSQSSAQRASIVQSQRSGYAAARQLHLLSSLN